MKKREVKKNKEKNIYQREASLENKKKVISIAAIVAIIVIVLAICIAAIVMDSKENEAKKQVLVQNGKIENKNNENAENENDNNPTQNNQTTPKALESDAKQDVYTDSEGNQAPIPKGYIASPVEGEKLISTGLVIYEDDGTGSFDGSDTTAVENAQKTRNQYVWVPVPDASEMYGTDANGKKWGKLYEFGKYNSSTQNYDVYNEPKALNWNETVGGVMKITQTTSVGSYREPDILKDYDKDSILKSYGLRIKTAYEFEIELEREFERMIASVEKYGGFYIGRYETGNWHEEIPVVVKGNNDISATKTGTNADPEATWYAYYQKSKKLAGANENVRTSMIWGCQWDACLKWMLTSEDEEVVRYVTDSTGKGNYTGSERTTGFDVAYSVNNIYDMAGNVLDWTIETSSAFYRVSRRGLL